LVILSAAHVQLAGDIQEIQRAHKRLVGPRQDEAAIASVHSVIEASHAGRQTTLLVRTNGAVFGSCWEVQEVSLEDIVLAYLPQQKEPQPQPQAVSATGERLSMGVVQ